MLRDDGGLWHVRFSGVDVVRHCWHKAESLALIGRVLDGGLASVPRREGSGALPDWVATLALPDGRVVRRAFRGLTQVLTYRHHANVL